MPTKNSVPSIPRTRAQLLHGDCLTILSTLKDASVDLICTDPPYAIGFRGETWDRFGRQGKHSFQAWWTEVSRECLRVLKPGGFMFVAMTPRQDSLCRAMIAMEDAGFRIHFTSLYWSYASGFPKALNVSKAVDRRVGAERKAIGHRKQHDIRSGGYGSKKAEFTEILRGGPVTPAAKSLDGAYAGFQPKPAVETILVAMRPLSKATHVEQALHNGKGVTWLDDCRIPTNDRISVHDAPAGTFAGGPPRQSAKNYRANTAGRFPANLVVSDGVLASHSRFFSLDAWSREMLPFLMVAKASKREKILVPAKSSVLLQHRTCSPPQSNTHPTVKPLALMAYLIALGSRAGDVVLDPFLGSGTTAVAANLLGRHAIGIERDAGYLAIARTRMGVSQPSPQRLKSPAPRHPPT